MNLLTLSTSAQVKLQNEAVKLILTPELSKHAEDKALTAIMRTSPRVVFLSHFQVLCMQSEQVGGTVLLGGAFKKHCRQTLKLCTLVPHLEKG